MKCIATSNEKGSVAKERIIRKSENAESVGFQRQAAELLDFDDVAKGDCP